MRGISKVRLSTLMTIRNFRRAFLTVLLEGLESLGNLSGFDLQVFSLTPLMREEIQDPGLFSKAVSWIVTNHSNSVMELESGSDYVPKVGYVQLDNVKLAANPRVSALISGSNFLYRPAGKGNASPVIPISDPPMSGLLHLRGSKVLIRTKVTQKIGAGIFVGTDSPHNWYHWLIDTLPAVYLSNFLPEEFSQFPLLIPEKALVRRDWIDLLQICKGERRVEIINEHHYSEIGRLVWILGPTARTQPSKENGTPQFAMERHAIDKFRNHVLSQLQISVLPNQYPRRIFLARHSAALRPYNQEDLVAVARKYGFECLYQEELSFKQTATIMQSAEYLVGPHGAGWGSALFSERVKGALIWTWDEAATENWFFNVLAVRGIPFSTILTGPGSNDSPYVVSPFEFERSLRNILGIL